MGGCEDVLRRVPAKRWNAPSPCEGWTAREVAGHLIGAIRWGTGLIAGEIGPPPDTPVRISGDVFTSWRSARRGLEAVITPETLERRVRWPFGEQTVDRGLGLFSLEVVIHTWDIARAAELDVVLDPCSSTTISRAFSESVISCADLGCTDRSFRRRPRLTSRIGFWPSSDGRSTEIRGSNDWGDRFGVGISPRQKAVALGSDQLVGEEPDEYL